MRKKQQRSFGQFTEARIDLSVRVLRLFLWIVEWKFEAGLFSEFRSFVESTWQHEIGDLERECRGPNARGFAIGKDGFETYAKASDSLFILSSSSFTNVSDLLNVPTVKGTPIVFKNETRCRECKGHIGSALVLRVL